MCFNIFVKTIYFDMTKTVTFTIEAPTKSNVELLGDFTNWQEMPIKLKERTEGLYEANVKFRHPATYQYKYQLDGEWIEEMIVVSPACGTVPNPFGSRNFFIDIIF